MKVLFLILPLAFTCCRSQEETDDELTVETRPPEASETAVDSSLPGPERAKAAANRVRPALTRDLEKKGLHFGDPVFLRAFKEENVLEVWVRHRGSEKYELFRTYDVAAASGGLGSKLEEGDRQVPEGMYFFHRSGMKPDSTFHLAFNIGYPNAYDRHHERTGTFIMVHGNQVSIGCLAMTDTKIEEIYTLCDAALRNGQRIIRIHIFPFRMTAPRMARAADSKWIDFWRNLKQGYDWFERKHVPPDTKVRNGRYVFE
ncbi:transpeptidase ErfK/YbiS/YcfS/YnhG [Haloferula helveola]|uniref:Transpeptidase ErfK/YbiS/YcfS/YnhG n=1 Tax=Haloferula helveola TaxID=490095 RepID=A0ABN6H5P3_9BACT|nr:transpeptidase ErfK/YbiS/YcfS/YnhG [Haloferula helveola]